MLRLFLSRLNHIALLLRRLPGLLTRADQRRQLAAMRALCRTLPATLQQPLPQAMTALSRPVSSIATSDEHLTRELADLAVLLERRSPLGICLRRSLTRYYFLRPLDIPLDIVFGARFKTETEERAIGGHAWLERAGQPYYEAGENYEDFTPIYRWTWTDAAMVSTVSSASTSAT